MKLTHVFLNMVYVSSASPPTDSIVQANTYTVNSTICYSELYVAAVNDHESHHI